MQTMLAKTTSFVVVACKSCLKADFKICKFLAEHNLPFRVMAYFSELLKKYFIIQKLLQSTFYAYEIKLPLEAIITCYNVLKPQQGQLANLACLLNWLLLLLKTQVPFLSCHWWMYQYYFRKFTFYIAWNKN